MLTYELALRFVSPFVAHPYWPEMYQMIEITKKSGMNRAKSDANRRKALEEYLRANQMTLADFDRLKAASERPFHTDAAGGIIIPRDSVMAFLVAANDEARRLPRLSARPGLDADGCQPACDRQERAGRHLAPFRDGDARHRRQGLQPARAARERLYRAFHRDRDAALRRADRRSGRAREPDPLGRPVRRHRRLAQDGPRPFRARPLRRGGAGRQSGLSCGADATADACALAFIDQVSAPMTRFSNASACAHVGAIANASDFALATAAVSVSASAHAPAFAFIHHLAAPMTRFARANALAFANAIANALAFGRATP